uniref:SH3-containing GRB2-like protein 3-interacting protein 1 n=1 Tax=Lonchura striata TaxID=40157 RepID=UPI001293B3B9|nr:SH3-containing GRB2-like protein 3-interacting protein 1 [Lonchura striata domestica]
MMEGLKKRTRKAFGIRRKEKDTDSTGSPDRDGIQPSPHANDPTSNSKAEGTREGGNKNGKKTNGAPNGFYAEIDWDRYNSPELDEEGYSIRPEEPGYILWFWLCLLGSSLQQELGFAGRHWLFACHCCYVGWEHKPAPHGCSSGPSRKAGEDPAALAPLFGPPLESAFEEHKLDAALDQPEIWGSVQPINTNVESPKLPRPFPTGTPPPLPPKNVPATPPRTGSPLPPAIGGDQAAAEPKRDNLPSINDLDSIFGPVPSPKSAAATAEDKWVNFSDQSPENAAPELSPRPKAPSPAAGGPAEPPRPLPSPLVLQDAPKKLPEHPHLQDDSAEPVASPKDFGPGQRATPPPPPPPTYRAVVSSPGPASGSSSPARPGTPLATCGTPPPPPPRPPSRPKLPPGKPAVSDVSRPFSPPIHSSSPPPVAPLARAESTSSISSTNSLSAATTPTVENEQPSLVWFDRGKFYLTFEGSSRGPSPLTMGAQDTLPVAAAFTETVNAYFKGADPNNLIVVSGHRLDLMMISEVSSNLVILGLCDCVMFLWGWDGVQLCRTALLPRQVVQKAPSPPCSDTVQSDSNSKEFWVNMPNLMTHLKKVSEQKPQATYYNVDMLKYQVSAQGIQSTPLNLAVSWRCDPASTDLRIDYKYNTEAMTTPVALNNVQFLVPVDGGVTKLQAVLPPAVWNAEQQRILWKIPDISQKSENGGVGSLLARFQLAEGPSSPAPLAVQFTSEGSTLSSCDIELLGAGYRFSLVKKRFAAGKYLADN